MKTDLIKLAKLIKERKPIIVNNKLIKRVLGYDDMRDFAQEIGDWGYVTDFTYRDYQTENRQTFLRRFLRETFLD